MDTVMTGRLVLRRFTEADAPALFPMMSDVQVNRFLPYVVHTCVEDTLSYLEQNYLRLYRDADAGRLRADGLPLDMHCAICRKRADGGAGELIGFVSIDAEGEAFDMGYALAREAQGHGYATEAVTAMLAEARRVGYPFVTATHDELNVASGRVMGRCGMTYRYSYRERWQPKDIDVVFNLYQIDFARDVPTFPGYRERCPQHWV